MSESNRILPFTAFSRNKPVRIYYGDLPHWRQEGCTYFVTFRCADALPPAVLEHWRSARDSWLIQQGVLPHGDRNWRDALKRLEEEQRQEFARMFRQAMDRELDKGFGECLLKRSDSVAAMREALLFYDQERWDVGDFVIMGNHVHGLMTPYEGEKLEEVLKVVKGYAAREVNRRVGRTGSLWQKESYDHIVRGVEELERVRRYIAENPAKAGVSALTGALYEVRWEPG